MKKVLLLGLLAVLSLAAIADNQPCYLENRIIRDNGSYIYNGSIISKTEVEMILEKSPSCYDLWKSGNSMITAGWVFCGIGGGLALGGLCCIASSSVACISLCCSGLACELITMGLSLGGSARKDKAIDRHNARLMITSSGTPNAAPVEFGFAIQL